MFKSKQGSFPGRNFGKMKTGGINHMTQGMSTGGIDNEARKCGKMGYGQVNKGQNPFGSPRKGGLYKDSGGPSEEKK